jgi:hypothetical protein
LRGVQPFENRVDGGRTTASVLFPFHQSSITPLVRQRNLANSQQAEASVPAISDCGHGRSSARIEAEAACPLPDRSAEV